MPIMSTNGISRVCTPIFNLYIGGYACGKNYMDISETCEYFGVDFTDIQTCDQNEKTALKDMCTYRPVTII